VHRSLGVKASFVQSTTMDSWTPLHKRMMELGGNQRFANFLKEQGVPEGLPIREKYSTCAAQWYRDHLRAEAEGAMPPAPLPPGAGPLPVGETGPGGEVLDQVFAKAALPCITSPPASDYPPSAGKFLSAGSLCGKLRDGFRLACGVARRESAEETDDGMGDADDAPLIQQTSAPNVLDRRGCRPTTSHAPQTPTVAKSCLKVDTVEAIESQRCCTSIPGPRKRTDKDVRQPRRIPRAANWC